MYIRKIRFTKDNKILNMQDFFFRKGMPAEIEFEMYQLNEEDCRFVAPGYGGIPYGNGAIFVKSSHLPAELRPKKEWNDDWM